MKDVLDVLISEKCFAVKASLEAGIIIIVKKKKKKKMKKKKHNHF